MISSRRWCCCWCFLFLCTAVSNGPHVSCVFFKTDNEPVSSKINSTVVLHFSVINLCDNDNGTVVDVDVRRWTSESNVWIVICIIRFLAEECYPTPGCTCDSQALQFTVTSHIEGPQSQQWELNGKLKSGEKFHKVVERHVISTHTVATPPTPRIGTQDDNVPSSEEASTFALSTKDTKETPNGVPSDRAGFFSTSTTPDESFSGVPLASGVVLPACMGGILILVLAVLVRVEMTRRRLAGRSSNLPPPPPAPHVFRRPVPDAVAFHIQPDAEDGRVSFLSVRDHVYEVMPGEDSTSSDDAIDASPPDSSSVSHSTTSDDSLLHIACPSSDSSLTEGYLHPVASPEEASSEPERTSKSMTDLHEYSNDKSAQAEPPYENVGNAP